jgi:hypothetical protein
MVEIMKTGVLSRLAKGRGEPLPETTGLIFHQGKNVNM